MGARLLLLLAFLTIISGASAEEPLLRGIKGGDDRMRVDSREYPWSAIGRLNKRTGGHCTGTLIGPDLVLTAAHCLWNKRTRRFLPEVSLHFVAGWQRGEYLAHSKAKAVYVPRNYRPGPAAKPKLPLDWALVTLHEPVGEKTGFLGVESLDRKGLATLRKKGAVFAQAGYSQDKKHVLTVHPACRLAGFTSGADLIAHYCDAVPGDSGSPMFRVDGDGFHIVGIHVATTKNRVPALGLAVPSATFVAKSGTRPPKEGAGAPVKSVAALLGRLGYVDVEAYEKANGLASTGMATPALLGRLIGDLAPPHR